MAVFGQLQFVLAMLQSVVGLQASILLCAALFLVAILICVFVDQARGQLSAAECEERNGRRVGHCAPDRSFRG